MRRGPQLLEQAVRALYATGGSIVGVPAGGLGFAALQRCLSYSLPQQANVLHQDDAPSTSGRDAARQQPLHRHHAQPAPTSTGGPLAKYTAGIQSGSYRPDPRQELTVQMLQELYDNVQRAGATHHLPGQHGPGPRRRRSGLTMVDHVADPISSSSRSSNNASASSWWSDLTRMMISGDDDDGGSAAGAAPAIQGLYMYGGVGCGKTMLMDLFVETAPVHFRVLRTHFHDFMLDVHSQLRKYSGDADPLLRVADSITSSTRVLALDEFFVTDVADAMILARLFGRLWDRGLVLVATSNRHPDDLYKGGLQRNLFLPFIHRLKTQCRTHDMASTTDYRKMAQHQGGLYFVEAGSSSSSSSSVVASASAPAAATDGGALLERFQQLAAGAPVGPARVKVMMGRELQVPLAAGRCCMFSFSELLSRPVAAADFFALTEAYHTLALRGVPVFKGANRTEAYRFVTLIDVMYENRTRLVCSAEGTPVELFDNIITQFDATCKPDVANRPDAVVDDNLGFAKDRTISRLTEMQSLEYLMAHAQKNEPALLLALQEAQQKQRQQEVAAAAVAVAQHPGLAAAVTAAAAAPAKEKGSKTPVVGYHGSRTQDSTHTHTAVKHATRH